MKHSVTSYNTRKLLSRTLKEIVEEKEISKISISEVAEKANLNRKTFYYHFSDIYDLLSWTLEDEMFRLVESFDLTVDYAKAIKYILDYVEENYDFIKSVMDTYVRHKTRRFLFNGMHGIALKTINEISAKHKIYLEEEYKSFVAGFSVEAVIGTIMYWVDHPDYNRAKLEKYLVRVFRVTIENLGLEESKH